MLESAGNAVTVPGERLAEFLRDPPGALTEVEVTSPPPSWARLKPLFVRFLRSYWERGLEPPVFGGVPLCLFGSEWSGFRSRPRTTLARGRCAPCGARQSCGFPAEVPDELLPISEAPLLQRWRDYSEAFHRVTGSDVATACTPFVERILSAYRGPVSLDPSVLISDVVQPSTRFVVFPHRIAAGVAGETEYRDVLACVRDVLRDLGAERCEDLVRALGSLSPSPIPLGLEVENGSWRVKFYLRLEGRTVAEKEAVVHALSPRGATIEPVSLSGLEMLGLVLDERGLHTIKAYVVARPTRHEVDEFPPPLAPDHPLVCLTGDRALATLDVWCRDARRPNKWDFNVREHYLAGESAERLAGQIASERSAAELRPLLVGPTYRADVIAVGVRGNTVALYMELN
jgi:hypothetical protein